MPNPLQPSRKHIEEKLMANAQRALSGPRAEELRNLLLNIDACADVRAIDARLGSD